MCSRWLLFHSHWWSPRRFFSAIYCGSLVELLGIVSRNCRKCLWLCLPGMFNLATLWSSHPAWVPWLFCSCFLLKWIMSPCMWQTVFLVLGQHFSLRLHLSHSSKKSCWFFSLFSFSLVLGREWQLPNSLHVEPETRNLPFPLILNCE